MSIDLNADVGEGYVTDGRLIPLLSSANICCGVHAGSIALTASTMAYCQQFGVAVGAHPSYPDRPNFGRTTLPFDSQVADSICQQLLEFSAIANKLALPVQHVKAHGALYNDLINQQALAVWFTDLVQQILPGVALMTMPYGALYQYCQTKHYQVIGEGFADRRYQADGRLTPRSQPDALLDANQTLTQASRLAAQQPIDGVSTALVVQSICLHGDGPHALQSAKLIRQQLLAQGYCISKVAQ